MSFINQFLASLLEKFKTQNPSAFAIIAAVVTGLFVLANDPTFIAYFADQPWVPKTVEVISYVAALFGGTHTSHITHNKV
jgi:hypothetical protein